MARLAKANPDADVIIFDKFGYGFNPCDDKTGDVEFDGTDDDGDPVPYDVPNIFGIFHPELDNMAENNGLPELCFN